MPQIIPRPGPDYDIKTDIENGFPKDGNTYHVMTAANGGADTNSGTFDSPFLTIDYAVGQCTADNGDVIYVHPGTYDENANAGGVEVDVAGITIIGINSPENQEKIIVVNSNGAASAVFTVSDSNVKIHNMSVLETTNTVAGIVNSGNNNIFEDLFMEGAMTNGIESAASTDLLIKNCVFAGQTNDGVELSGASVRNVITGCRFNAVTEYAIHFNGGGTDNNLVTDTVIDGEGTTTAGILLDDADENIITQSVYITRCNTGNDLQPGSQYNIMGANITKCTTYVNFASGNSSNGLGPSVTQIHRDIHRIPSFTGDIWYVDGTNGDDTNYNGKHPEAAFATIGAGIAAASAGDRVKVFAGTYDEAGLDLNLAGLELVCEWGTIIRDTTPGVCLTVSANYCVVKNAVLYPTTAQVGLDITSGASFVEVDGCLSFGCSIGYDVNGVGHNIHDCRSISHGTTGFDVSSAYCKFTSCSSNGTNGAVRGYYLSVNSADNNIFIECLSSNNTTASWEIVAGANQNTFTLCMTGGTDAPIVDAGTSNTWGNCNIMIDDMSEYNDATNGRLQANKVYPIFEVLVSSGTVTAYKYVLTDNIGDPTEIIGRTEIEGFPGNAFELTDMTVNLDYPTSGILDRVAGTEKFYFFLLYYESTNSEWKFYPVGVDDGTGIMSPDVEVDMSGSFPNAAPAGSNICDLPAKADFIPTIYFSSATSETRIILAMYTDTSVNTGDVDVPFFFSINKIGT